MDIFRHNADLQDFLKDKKQIGFVPTMGYLHGGHLSLIKKAIKGSDCVVVSTFVNPTQFNDKSDFENYPRDENRDLAMLESLKKIDAVFLPSMWEMYEEDNDNVDLIKKDEAMTFVIPENLENCLCGRTRPGHFAGVVDVVTRLLRIINNDKEEGKFDHVSKRKLPKVEMYLGEKDYQQMKILTELAKTEFTNVTIIPCPIVRETDGLAMSSRNVLLKGKDRQIGTNLYKGLCLARDKFLKIDKKMIATKLGYLAEFLNQIQAKFKKDLKRFPHTKIDYIEILDADDLREVSINSQKIIIAGAIFVGKVRLIDNIVMNIN